MSTIARTAEDTALNYQPQHEDDHVPEGTAALLNMPDDVPWEQPKRSPVARLAALGYAQEAQPLTADDVDPAGALLATPAAIGFMLAGNATFTLVSKNTLKRFTFKLTRPKDDPVRDNRSSQPPRRTLPIWVSVLSGPNNDSDYAYLGTIWQNAQGFEYAVGKKSRVDKDAGSQKAAAWLTKALVDPSKFDQCEIWHEGKCGRCGRKLTVPSSIASGIGPECATRM